MVNPGKLIDIDRLNVLLNTSLNRYGRIGFTNGVFDILHVGHARYLKKAKGLCDTLIVGINTDASVKCIKGDKRPVLPWDERVELVAALDSTDFIVPLYGTTADALIRAIKPHIYIKGGDYKEDKIIEADTAREIGAMIATIPTETERSTSDIVHRVLLNYATG